MTSEQIVVLVDGAEEPSYVEAPGEVEQAGAAGHQHQAAVPHRLEFGAGHHRRTRRQRVLDQDLVLAGLAENEVAPLAEHRDAGERGMDQPPPVRLIDARLELKFLPAPQHFGDADVGAEAVAYLLGVSADAMDSTKAASPDWPGVGFSVVTDTLFSKGRLGGSQAAGLHQQLITRWCG
jgi:hypothetical protein